MEDLADALARARAEEERKARGNDAEKRRAEEHHRAGVERGRLLVAQFIEEARRAGLPPDFHITEQVAITEQYRYRHGWGRVKVSRLSARRVSCWALPSKYFTQRMSRGKVPLQRLVDSLSDYRLFYFLDESGQRRIPVSGTPQPLMSDWRTFQERRRVTLTFQPVPPSDRDIVYEIQGTETMHPVSLETALVEYLLHRPRPT